MQAIQGVIAPNLTPFNDDLTIATDLYITHAHSLLADGCSALAPFGTTGEALSLGIAERKATLEALVHSGIDPAQLIPGTGLTSLPDTMDLTKHAMDLGCFAAMTLPPFYFKGVSDDGLFGYFKRLIDAIADDRLKLVLYHIPPVTQIGFSLELVDRLASAFPGTIVGIKDSSGDFAHTAALLEAQKALMVYPGSELNLVDAVRLGAPGCITATANVNASAIASAYALRMTENAAKTQQAIAGFRKIIQPYGPIPAMKALISQKLGDLRWRNVRPPLDAIYDGSLAELSHKLACMEGRQVS